VFECVINISEGRDAERLAALAVAAGSSLRDVHSDAAHHRSVFTLINSAPALRVDVRSLIRTAVATLDLSRHEGVHPRLGVVDVVPFVALSDEQASGAIELRDETARWMSEELGVASFLYGSLADGSQRTLPEIRRRAYVDLTPDFGPFEPSLTTGASALGVRGVLVAWNIWLQGASLSETRRIAAAVRSPVVRALGLDVGDYTQVSCNLIDVRVTRPSEIYDQVAGLLADTARIARSELVGLAPRSLLEHEDPQRWEQLDLRADRTIESRLGR
jgi:glutamate formiminotransferase